MSIFSKIKKWTVGRWIKSAVVVLAPVAGTVVGGPVVGGAVVAALGAAGLTKAAGKKIEEKTGKPVHKSIAPVVAVSLPALLAQLLLPFLKPEWLQMICEAAAQLCPDDGIIPVGVAGTVGAVGGLIALLAHQFGTGVEKTIDGRQ